MNGQTDKLRTHNGEYLKMASFTNLKTKRVVHGSIDFIDEGDW